MKPFLLFFFCTWTLCAQGQSPSVLSSGKWRALSVQVDAVYKIDYSLLQKSGINPDNINPSNIQLFTGNNGMLPQANSTPRVNDLKELAIYIQGGDDGKFNKEDYILFYGQGPDSYQLLSGNGVFKYENNLYSDKNFYYLTVGSGSGKRMASIESIPGNFPTISEFDDFAYYETEQYNDLHSGREWFGEQFDSKTEYTIRFEIPGILDGSPMKLISGVMGQSFSESSFQLSLNDVAIRELKPSTIINSQYAEKGSKVADTTTFSSTIVNASSRTNQDLKIKFIKATTGRSIGYLDYLLLQSKRKLSLNGDQMIFHSLKSVEQPTSNFTLSAFPIDGAVWDITDSFDAKVQKTSIQSGVASFGAASTTLRKYIALSNKNFLAPVDEGDVPNQNLHGVNSMDLLIVSAPDFLSEAQRLASYRESKNGIKVVVVTTTQVYHEFSGGKQDVSAIRDAVKYFYSINTGIKNLLLFGRGSYDYKNYLPYNKNFVPTYESRNSLAPLQTYASDDYFTFLENSEGNWGEDPIETHTMDIGVGRLPIKKIDEAIVTVNKIIEYESQPFSDWRKELLFVADDGDFNLHQGQSDQLAESVEQDHPEFNTRKLFLDQYKQINSAIGQISPAAASALEEKVRQGVLIVNYTGHGSEQQWMQERIFDQISLDKWKTNPKYPFLITATCEFGRNDDPGIIATSELSLLKKGGGSIGLVTTTRPVFSGTNFQLNIAFYQSLFTKDHGLYRTLGSVMRDTKNTSASGVSNRNFTLLGDPSMTLLLPRPEVSVTQIQNISSASDTLKALSKVRIKGLILNSGITDANFSGTVVATLFDKPVSRTTAGDENVPFTFKSRDNAIFDGQATVQNGQFQLEFSLPKSINPTVGAGKLSLYAFSKSRAFDVNGGVSVLKIGSLEKDSGADTKPPDIELFIGDTTFVNGGLAGNDSKIVAILSDKSGINISDFDSQNQIIAVLDDTTSIVLNRYYQSDTDNFSRGKISFPVVGLKPGFHHIKLSASDIYNNRGSASISFSVSDQAGIQIERWLNYPNPVVSSTTFHFEHNRSGEDLEALVTIFDPLGQPLLYNTYQITSSAYQVDLPEWEAILANGSKLSSGLYLLKLSLRSLTDGTKSEKITKFVISN